MAKRTNSNDPSVLDPLMAAQAADAFLQHSQAFVQSLPTDPKQTEATAGLGEVVASATLLSLSVELFLKSLLIFAGCRVPSTHDLIMLYDALPEGAKDAVDGAHRVLENADGGGAVALRLVYIPSGQESPGPEIPGEAVRETSVRAVLERNRDAFCSWRYLHEIAVNTRPVVVDYEYHQLTAIALAVSEVCRQIVQGSESSRP